MSDTIEQLEEMNDALKEYLYGVRFHGHGNPTTVEDCPACAESQQKAEDAMTVFDTGGGFNALKAILSEAQKETRA